MMGFVDFVVSERNEGSLDGTEDDEEERADAGESKHEHVVLSKAVSRYMRLYPDLFV